MMRAHTPRFHTQHPQSRSIVSTLSHASTVRILLLHVIKCCMMRAHTPRFHSQHPQSRSIASTLSHASTVIILSHTPRSHSQHPTTSCDKVLHDACSHHAPTRSILWPTLIICLKCADIQPLPPTVLAPPGCCSTPDLQAPPAAQSLANPNHMPKAC